MNTSSADFIASEAQYLRILDRITNEGVRKRLLLRAVEQGKTAFVQVILDKNPDWIQLRDVEEYESEPLLHIVAKHGYKDITAFLIKKRW